MSKIEFRILGQPFSKANSRRIVDMPVAGTDRTRPASIKSKDAIAYERDALQQIPTWARQMLEGPVRVSIRIFYASERPDLDESVILDVLQAKYKKVVDGQGKTKRILIHRGVYNNDRQVREKHIYHGIDKANPRSEICVEPLTPQQPDMLAPSIGTMLNPLEEPKPLRPISDPNFSDSDIPF